MIKGDDGGAAVSFNGGNTWSTIMNQPTAQLYHVTTDDHFPYSIYGSQQDNTAIALPSQTIERRIHERSSFIPGGGESGYIAIKPDEPWHIVASGPAGRHIYNDIMTHYDRRTGQIRNITVWPDLYGWGVGRGGAQIPVPVDLPDHVLPPRPARCSTSRATSSSGPATSARASRSSVPI